ncbi:hypothetical protein PCANC_24093, partial [Puccinia coronata f. sp. avenae]
RLPFLRRAVLDLLTSELPKRRMCPGPAWERITAGDASVDLCHLRLRPASFVESSLFLSGLSSRAPLILGSKRCTVFASLAFLKSDDKLTGQEPGTTAAERVEIYKYLHWTRLGQAGQESCVAKTLLSGGMGLGLGAMFSLMSSSFAYKDPLRRDPTFDTMNHQWMSVGRTGSATVYGKNLVQSQVSPGSQNTSITSVQGQPVVT